MKKNLIQKSLIAFALLMFVMMTFVPVTFASSGTPTIVSGTQNLANDFLRWILILVPVTAALAVAYHAWMKSMADGDPGVAAERNKKIKTVLIFSVIAESAAGLVTLVLNYYK